MTGIEIIAEERERQIVNEGFDDKNDSKYKDSELLRAAACYIAHEDESWEEIKELWPWNESWWKPGDKIRNLAKAGALIAAEIDRLQKL